MFANADEELMEHVLDISSGAGVLQSKKEYCIFKEMDLYLEQPFLNTKVKLYIIFVCASKKIHSLGHAQELFREKKSGKSLPLG